MGLLNWIAKECGDRYSLSLQSQVPSFEQLEPRILRSADACLVPDVQALDTCEEQVISVDLEPG